MRAGADRHILMTGATGFVGTALLEHIARLNRMSENRIDVTFLVRNPRTLSRSLPDLSASSWMHPWPGDIRVPLSSGMRFDGIIHAATPSHASGDAPLDPQILFDTIVTGTRNVLELAATLGDIPVLMTSSGAVYGVQPPEITHLDENFSGASDPLDINSVYGAGKRAAESLCAVFANKYGVRAKIARMFAFVGPRLPLDRHFAIGNFIGAALAGKPIDLTGDGRTVRSYLDAGDMAEWLWAIFERGEQLRAYNVGSETAVDLASVAATVSRLSVEGPPVRILGHDNGRPPHRYVPSTQRARNELGLRETFDLESAIERAMRFYSAHPDVR